MIAMALLVRAKSYYYEMDYAQKVTVGAEKACQMVVPELEKQLTITFQDNCAQIAIAGEPAKWGARHSEAPVVLNVPINESAVLDYENQVAVFFSHVSQSDKHIYFDSNCRVEIGRSEKRAADGSENTVVVKLPFVSSKHMEFLARNGKLIVRDKSSKNGTFVNGEKITQREIVPGDVISVLTFRMIYNGNSLSFFNAGNALSIKTTETSTPERNDWKTDEAAFFERSVRLKNSVEAETIVLPSPPAVSEKPQIDYLSTFLPAAVTAIIGVALYFTSRSASSLLYSLPMSLSGVIISVVNFQKQIRKYTQDAQAAEENFQAAASEATEKLRAFNSKQLSVMEAENPDISRLINAAQTRNSILWNRRASDEDFLTVRLGTGKAASLADIQTNVPSGSAASKYAQMCSDLKEQYSWVDAAPICCDLRKSHITGVVGKNADTGRLLSAIMIQLAGCYCYTDLRIVYLSSGLDINWVSKLPHARGLCASTKAEADRVMEEVFAILRKRKAEISNQKTFGNAPAFSPYIMLVAADPALLSKNHSVQEYIINGAALGTGMILAVENLSQLPMNCEAVIRMNGSRGELFYRENASQITAFSTESVSDHAAMSFAKAIENVRVEEPNRPNESSTLPKKYSLYEMLGIRRAEDLDLKERWQQSDVCSALKAPLGIGMSGIVELDISGNDAADGPHGLVAGTTGSGKSETIVSYLLALTTLYSPLDLSLVIIDFKGGAMCNKFKGVPHLVGSITNLADKEIGRALKSLNAELKHRQKLLEDASNAMITHDIDNVNKYTRLFKAGKVKEPMPHMLIVVDEFAELKGQYPEFLNQLISAARIGRSLGIHLILATQKPAGQVSDQIWSNSKFRIALKVQTEQDSKEVIKCDLASKIKEAGRAYLAVGNNERFELFQSGYSGTAVSTAGNAGNITQFSAVARHIADFCGREGISQMPKLFLEPLPECAAYLPLNTSGDAAGTVALGFYDDPENQHQEICTVPLTRSNLLIIGSAQMGKTNLLQCILRGLAEHYSPKEVEIYILDFASQLLRKYEGLNHVGGVVTSMEDEKLKHLLQLLSREFAIRKDKFARAGVSSLTAYRELGLTDVSHIVVMIDNFTALKELYFEDDSELIQLCRDGLSVGITVIAANSQTKGIGYKYLSYFDSRIALYNNDSSEYGVLFDHCRETVEKIPGRYLAMQDNRLLDCQAFLAFDGGLNAAIGGFVADEQAQYGQQRAARIPELPARVTVADLVSQCGEIYQDPYSIVLGLDYETVMPAVRNIRKAGCLSLSGGTPEAQSLYLSGMIRQMDAAYPGKIKIWILDSIDRMLHPLEALPSVVSCRPTAAALPEIVAELEQKAKARMAMLELGDADGLSDAEMLVLVINDPGAADIMNANRTALASFSALISKYRSMGVCVLVSNVPNASFISSEFYKKCAENKQFLWFDNLPALKLITVPYAVSKKFSKKLAPGDAYLFNDTECTKLKTPLA